MTVILEELIVDLAQDAATREAVLERDGIDRRIIEHFDLSQVRGRRTYLLCFGEKTTDVSVDLAVMDMTGRESALIGDLLALKAHAERYGLFPFPVVARGSWVSLHSQVHYPCLKADASGQRAVVELVPGINHWPADMRFLLVDKPA